MGWRTQTSALPIRDPCQIAYLLPMWGGIWSGVVFLRRRLICPQNNRFRMFWCRDWNSSHFFPRFGLLEHEANKTPDISATFIGSRKKFCKRKRMSVRPARKRQACILSVSYRLNRFNRRSRWKSAPLQILCRNMVRTWYSFGDSLVLLLSLHYKKVDDFVDRLSPRTCGKGWPVKNSQCPKLRKNVYFYISQGILRHNPSTVRQTILWLKFYRAMRACAHTNLFTLSLASVSIDFEEWRETSLDYFTPWRLFTTATHALSHIET